MSWEEGEEERAESLRGIRARITQFRTDASRSWKVFRKSILAVTGLAMVVSVSVISFFADDIAVEHPGRDLQDSRDTWNLDYEPELKAPFSEECDWHEQTISLTTLRRWDYNWTEALSHEQINPDDRTLYRETLEVIELISLGDRLGYALPLDLVTLDADNSSLIWMSDELMENSSLNTVKLVYVFDNEEMHHWWLPDGYDVCIFGTNKEGNDLFSKVLYGSRISLKIGFTVATLTVIIGTVVGSISGYYGGRVDEVIMRITDVFFAVPGLILAMAFVAALQAVESFIVPLWLGILIPICFIAFSARSVVSESILPPTGSGKENQVATNSLLRSISLLLAVFVALGGIWQGVFEVSESWLWRASASVTVILLVASLVVFDRAMLDRASFEGLRNRASDVFDWRNPYRYLTLRTVMIFVAAVILHRWSGDTDGEITVIQEFDRLWKIQVALVFTGWPGYARLIRGQVLYVKEMTFVEAARSVGAPPGRIMFRHILPNAWAPLLVAFTLDIGGTILSASGLSFIGLGAPPLSAEWGRLVSDGRTYFPQAWWLVLFPGLAIATTTLGFNLLGDGIRDVVDPKNRR
tara:strand:- start:10723 stop:12468 length:1746 start_codon:yes stop_codon:yes gene_type:complete